MHLRAFSVIKARRAPSGRAYTASRVPSERHLEILKDAAAFQNSYSSESSSILNRHTLGWIPSEARAHRLGSRIGVLLRD